MKCCTYETYKILQPHQRMKEQILKKTVRWRWPNTGSFKCFWIVIIADLRKVKATQALFMFLSTNSSILLTKTDFERNWGIGFNFWSKLFIHRTSLWFILFWSSFLPSEQGISPFLFEVWTTLILLHKSR